MKKALICGISGQDGGYLAKLLLEKQYAVVGTSRDAEGGNFHNIKKLQIFSNVRLVSMAPSDFANVLGVLQREEPDEIYYLAGQSSVGLSFGQPTETLESIATGYLNVLEAVRFLNLKTKIYNAGSSECFGNSGQLPANINTPFFPKSPYAIAKTTAYWLTVNYRESYGIYACTGMLFNHESPLRQERFVTQKIISSAVRISRGEQSELRLGDISISRDWGWAPDFVEAMWLMLQQKYPRDFVICTGEAHTLEDFVKVAFDYFNLDYRKYLVIDESLIRPNEIKFNVGDNRDALEILGWSSKVKFKDIINSMIESKITSDFKI